MNKEVKIVNKSQRVAIIEYLITFDLNISCGDSEKFGYFRSK
jgi:hypothetical protein